MPRKNRKNKISLGPIKLKPTQIHKPKKDYDRKKEKRKLEKQIKIAAA